MQALLVLKELDRWRASHSCSLSDLWVLGNVDGNVVDLGIPEGGFSEGIGLPRAPDQPKNAAT